MKLEFTPNNMEITQELTSKSELFTNCSTVYVTRIVCGHSYPGYASVDDGIPRVIPPGIYKFRASAKPCANGECWLCIESTADVSAPIPVNTCFKNPATGINRKGFLLVTDGDIAGADRVFQDGTAVPANYVFEEDCC